MSGGREKQRGNGWTKGGGEMVGLEHDRRMESVSISGLGCVDGVYLRLMVCI